ncbi:MAG: DUF4921 family protein [Chlorobi bacterium CHB2]|nr:DUF4921 family protein [Chlorobi bacterium CHB2]
MKYSAFYNIMPDGTVKQINPFTGNEVWAVPERASKPAQNKVQPPEPASLEGVDRGHICAFCSGRYLETAPEKFRYVREDGAWHRHDHLPADSYFATTAEFRCFANLFEIVTLDYWKQNYGYIPPPETLEQLRRHAATEAGLQHLRAVVEYKQAHRNRSNGNGKKNGATEEKPALSDDEILALSEPMYAGCHELIVARNHYHPDGTTEADLLSSGRLTPTEHYQYFKATIESLRRIVERNRYVRYVSVFQNWLKGAGASFDHLHKQLVGLDEWGASITRQVKMLKKDPNAFNEYAVNFAAMFNLVFAENEHAIAFVGIGHRFPTIEIFSKSRNARPWEHTPEELQGVSDLIHACHAATGAEISCNEEWYYSPIDAVVKMPWHVLIKWRIHVQAGFEGGTSIFLNPMTPVELRDRIVPRLYALRDEGTVRNVLIAEECHIAPNPLNYYR